MASGQSPTVRRRRLGIELRRLREAAGLTCEQVGEVLEWSGAKVSRMETGKVAVRPRDVRDLLDLYKVTEKDHREALLTITRESRQKGWWHAYGAVHPSWIEVYVGLEAEATAVREFEMRVLPGLLQTEEYARAAIRAAWTSETPEQIERQTAFRMARQTIFKKDHPTRFSVILDEATLRREVGGPGVLHRQLKYLASTAMLPYVTIQILPFSVGSHPGIDGGFKILDFADPDPSIVYIEHCTGSLYLERAEEIGRYNMIFDHLRRVALSAAESISLIEKVAKDILPLS